MRTVHEIRNDRRRGTIRWCLFMLAMLFVFCDLLLTEAARAEGFYLETGVSIYDQVQTRSRQVTYLVPNGIYSDGSQRYSVEYRDQRVYRDYDINDARNPYASIAFGYAHTFKCFSLECGLDGSLFHISSIATGRDHGINAINVCARIYFGDVR